MVGLERSILPQLAEVEFEVAANSALMSFIAFFGLAKAGANAVAGRWANRVGRKRLLVIGWWFAVPVPILIMFAPSWGWVVAANVLLGINQGLAWSSTVAMKMDLVGRRNRGLAMGLNESAGYLAVGGVALLSGYVASQWGLRPAPFLMGLAFAVIGLVASAFFVKDTAGHVAAEAELEADTKPLLPRVFIDVTWRHRNLSAITQGGLVNNLNDGMVWGLFPLLLAARGFDLVETAQLVAIYPAVWGVGQILTGKLADLLPKRPLLAGGMALQGAAILAIAFADSFFVLAGLSALLGMGTAVVYPAFLAAIADEVPASQRAEAVGVFRMWRDLGYAFGAILTGVLADAWNASLAVLAIGGLTLLSAAVLRFRMLPPALGARPGKGLQQAPPFPPAKEPPVPSAPRFSSKAGTVDAPPRDAQFTLNSAITREDSGTNGTP